MVKDIIYVPSDQIRFPFYGKGMVIIENGFAKVIDVAEAGAASVAGAMDGAKDFIGQTADKLHEVDLTRLRPADQIDICAQTPEGRPDAPALRN